MKTKILALSALAFVALACVSCGESKEKGSPKPQRSVEEINTVDEEMTEKGKAVYYESNSKMTFANGMFREYTVRCNCFDDMLSANDSNENLYEYKYNADGLILESKSSEYGLTTVYTYDEHGEKIGEISYQNDLDISNARYENEYDENGRLVLQRQYNKLYDDTADEMLMYVTAFEYDGDVLISKTIDDRSGEDKPVVGIKYEYDDRGNITCETQTSSGYEDGASYSSVMYSTYNSHDLPEKQEVYANGELSMTYEYEYTFYD